MDDLPHDAKIFAVTAREPGAFLHRDRRGGPRPGAPVMDLADLGFMLGLPAMIYAMSRDAPALLDDAPIRWLGAISYSMYLWHFASLWRLGDYLQGWSFLLLFACTLVLTTVCASVTYLLIERPGIRLGSALLRGRFPRPPAQIDATTV